MKDISIKDCPLNRRWRARGRLSSGRLVPLKAAESGATTEKTRNAAISRVGLAKTGFVTISKMHAVIAANDETIVVLSRVLSKTPRWYGLG